MMKKVNGMESVCKKIKKNLYYLSLSLLLKKEKFPLFPPVASFVQHIFLGCFAIPPNLYIYFFATASISSNLSSSHGIERRHVGPSTQTRSPHRVQSPGSDLDLCHRLRPPRSSPAADVLHLAFF
jgi:hypothetical protein